MPAPISKGRYARGYARTPKLSDIVTVSELAAELEVARSVVGNWASRWADWPFPLRVLECGTLYSRSECLKVLKVHKRIADNKPKEG